MLDFLHITEDALTHFFGKYTDTVMVRGEVAIARASALKLYLSERIASEDDTDIERGYLASLAPTLYSNSERCRDALTGLWRYSLMTAKLTAAMQIARRDYTLAQEQHDAALLIEAYNGLAITLYWLPSPLENTRCMVFRPGARKAPSLTR